MKPVTTMKDVFTLNKGLNRFILIAKKGDEDISVRPVILDENGKYPPGLKYVVTLNEIDPK